MTSIPHKVIIRPEAVRDIEAQASYLAQNAPNDVSARFRVAVTKTIERIGSAPHAGSPYTTSNSLLSGLRMIPIPGFRNHLIFYLTSDHAVDVVRLLHGAQDINRMLELGTEISG